MTTALNRSLLGKKVTGKYYGLAYSGTVIESTPIGAHFRHVIKLDHKLTITHKTMGHDNYKGFKPMIFQGLSYNTHTNDPKTHEIISVSE
jgi:hypothetical protein